MRYIITGILFAATLLGDGGPVYSADGKLKYPADYRDWVFLSSGLGMTYGPAAPAPGMAPMFDNVFVNPPAWAEFKKTGLWPEGTIFILEIRYSLSKGSINQGGNFQTDVAAIEAAVKDTKRFPNGWGYFGFGGGLSRLVQEAAAMPARSGCQACHSANGAVDQTFTQFYPAALDIARNKGTLRPDYQELPASPVRVLHRMQQPDSDVTKVLNDTKAADPASPALTEMNVNMMGYALLGDGRKEQAVAVLAWNAEAYPRSANAQDSLAEALESAGKLAESRATSEKALSLLDQDTGLSDRRRKLIQDALNQRLERLQGK